MNERIAGNEWDFDGNNVYRMYNVAHRVVDHHNLVMYSLGHQGELVHVGGSDYVLIPKKVQ